VVTSANWMFGCTDAIWVHREQVPSALTGG
jgi:hypothetical protein